jgi:zinc protease
MLMRASVSLALPMLAFAAGLVTAPFGVAPAWAAMFNPETATLANGMQIVVIENHRAPVVTQMVWYKVGSADERTGKSGIAHYLEHLMFKATDAYKAGEFHRLVATNGGVENAFTTQDYTAYFENVAVDRLELVMRLESQRMAQLKFADETARPELQVVLEERRMRTDNSPQGQLSEQVNRGIFIHHPYGIPVIGWPAEVASLDYRDAEAFYKLWYHPNNVVLVVAGDVTLAQVKDLAERYFGPIASQAVPERKRVAEPPHHAATRFEMSSERVREPSWGRYYVAPSYHFGVVEQAYPLQVLAQILGGGETSRLYRALVLDGTLASSVSTSYDPDDLDYGSFSLSARPRPNADIAALETAIEGQIHRLLADGVTDDEVMRAKGQLQASAVYNRDSVRRAAQIIGQGLSIGRTLAEIEAWPDRIGAVTAAQVSEAARAVLIDGTAVTSLLRPAPQS